MKIIRIAALVAASFLAALNAQAQAPSSEWPTKPIRWIVPFPPGGGVDATARALGDKAGKILGQPFIIENRPGAGGNIGADLVAKAQGDTHVLMITSIGMAANKYLYARLAYDPVKDFAPVSLLVVVPNVLVTNATQPNVKTVSDVIAAARAQPGRLTYASAGNGTSIHLAGEMFTSLANVQMLHVPYKGSAPAVSDLLGNQIAIMFDNMPSAIQHVRSGKLRPIAVTTAKRSPELPDVPTIAEAGVPGYEATSWFGLFTVAGTPAPIVAQLNKALLKVLNQAEVKQKIAGQGGEVVAESPEQFAAFIKAESAKWGKVVKESGASAD